MLVVETNFVMEMGCGGATRIAGFTDFCTPLHTLAFIDGDTPEMTIQSMKAMTVVDLDIEP
jgi:hypothetical protein